MKHLLQIKTVFGLVGLNVCLIALVTSSGCVTQGQAKTLVRIRDYHDGHEIKRGLLLRIKRESIEKQGSWWIFEEQETGQMVIRSASVGEQFDKEKLVQPGRVVALIGPYMHERTVGWEYWFFHPSYQPERFYDTRLERRYEQKKSLDLMLLALKPGDPVSDERTLDSARRLVEIKDWLDTNDQLTADLVRLMIQQLQAVGKISYREKNVKQAAEFLAELKPFLQKFPMAMRQCHPADMPKILASDTAKKTATKTPTQSKPIVISGIEATPGQKDSFESPDDTPAITDNPLVDNEAKQLPGINSNKKKKFPEDEAKNNNTPALPTLPGK